MMRLSAVQQAPRGRLDDSQRLVATPPSIDTRFNQPATKKPTERPSGERNGLVAPSVPAMGVTASFDSSRRYRRRPSRDTATNTSTRASEDSARMGDSSSGSQWPGGSEMENAHASGSAVRPAIVSS